MRIGQRVVDSAVVGFLCIAVAVLFWDHLLGELTFPWDFQRGYFTRAVARMRDGSFLAPPLWLPWAGFGIPGHLSLQDGTWYLPQYVFDFLDVAYDMVGATRLQVMHVMAGAAGVYVLCRQLGFPVWAGAIAGVGYIFSGSFYSNAQHADIVRAAALFPWLLAAIHALLERVTAMRFLLCSLITWQFLVASYPGIVVSGGYAAALLLAAWAVVHLRADPVGSVGRLAAVTAAGLMGLGLAAVKFLPALADPENLRQSGGHLTLANGPVFTTLLLDFDVPFLPHDVTMRDLFLPLPVLLLAALGAGARGNRLPGLVLVVLGLAGLVDLPAVQRLFDPLPMMRSSRFQISDFRPVLHVGLCVWAAAGVTVLLRLRNRSWTTLLLLGLAVAGVAALLAYAAALGYIDHRVRFAATILLLSTGLLGWLCSRPPSSARGRYGALGALLVLLAASGYDHVTANGRVWKTPRTDAAEIAMFGRTIHELVSIDRFQAITARPARLQFTPLPAGRMALYDVRYDLAWIAEGFAAFGYEDLKGSAVFQRLYESANRPEGHPDRLVLEWLMAPSSTVLLNPQATLTPKDLLKCGDGCRIGTAPGTHARMTAFRENGAVYEIGSAKPFVLVENEPWYPGWRSLLCTNGGCRPGPEARSQQQVLRSWTLPAGSWRLITYFEPPKWRTAQTVSRAALMLLVLAVIALAWRGHRASQPSNDPGNVQQ